MTTLIDPETLQTWASVQIGRCKTLGITEEDLDELVHEAAASEAMPELNQEPNEDSQETIIETAEARASRINNSGMEAQITFLVNVHGITNCWCLIENLKLA